MYVDHHPESCWHVPAQELAGADISLALVDLVSTQLKSNLSVGFIPTCWPELHYINISLYLLILLLESVHNEFHIQYGTVEWSDSVYVNKCSINAENFPK